MSSTEEIHHKKKIYRSYLNVAMLNLSKARLQAGPHLV